MSALGILLRRHRLDTRLTQEELADRAGVSARTISDIERGIRSRAYTDTADRLSVALALDETDAATFMEASRGRSSIDDSALAPSRVPRPLTPLLGRERELAELVSALGTGGSRLVTVTGLGGVGKTRLALAAAAELEPFYDRRVHAVFIAANQDPALLMGSLARAIGLSERATPNALAASMMGRPTLVLLDTFEHVLAAAPGLEAVLSAAPDLRVLATSRERLRIAGEQEVALVPLAVPDPSDPRWSETPAAALFLERARAVRPDLEVDPDVVIDICRRVSGVPLALELAAARVRHLPLASLRDRLRTGIGDLADLGPDAEDRHRSMEQTLAWSTGSLTDDEARVLRVGALFPGGWRLDAVRSVCGDDVDAIEAVSGLVDKSLVFLDPSSAAVPRWRMLDVVREYVLGSASSTDPGDVRAFTEFHLGLLAEVEKNVGREREWFELLSAEVANVRMALTWASEESDAETLLRLAGGMWQFWQARGDLAEGRQWLATGLSLDPPATDATRMTALWGAGWLAYHQADDGAAEEAAAKLEELARRHGDDGARRNAITISGMVAISRDDATEAIALLEEALHLARDLGSDWILATSLLNLGMGHLAAGDTRRARAAIGEALPAYAEIGDERFHARCLGYLGMASLVEDDPDRARGLFGQSLAAFRELGEPAGMAEGMVGMAAVDAATGHLDRAATLAGVGERLRESYAGRELPLDRRTNARYLASAEERLGAEAWAEAWARGRELTITEAMDLALGSS
jgi:predicted ATPase/transcriptional regulator with XRE-family HTH domain